MNNLSIDICNRNSISKRIFSNYSKNKYYIFSNFFFKKRYNFFKLYNYFRKLVKFIKLGLSLNLVNSSYNNYRLASLYTDYKQLIHRESINNKIKNLQDRLDRIDFLRKKKRALKLLKIKQIIEDHKEKNKNDEKLKNIIPPEVGVVEESIKEDIEESLQPQYTDIIAAEFDEPNLEEWGEEELSSLQLKKDEKTQTYELLAHEALRGFDMSTFDHIHNAADQDAFDILTDLNTVLSIKNNTYNNYLVGTTPTMYNLVDKYFYVHFSNIVVFNKLEHFFKNIIKNEIGSCRYFKFNDFFLNIGSYKNTRSAIFDKNFFSKIIMNAAEYELFLEDTAEAPKPLRDKCNIDYFYNSADSEESSYDFFDSYNVTDDNFSNLYLSPIVSLTGTRIQKKNLISKSFFLKKPIYTRYRNVYNYFNFEFADTHFSRFKIEKATFSKLYYISIFKKMRKNHLRTINFFKFPRLRGVTLKKTDIKYFNILKYFFYKDNYINLKRLLKYILPQKKKYILFNKKKNFRLFSEFS